MAKKFPTKYDFDNSFNSATGNGMQDLYAEEFDDKGIRHLVVKGQTSVYDKIQSFAEDVDIYNILSRYFGGDVSVLDNNKGFYADVTAVPRNFNDFHNKIVEGQNIFGSLPIDFKAMFGNDVNRFVNSIYDGTYDKVVEDYNTNRVKHKFDNQPDIPKTSDVKIESEVKINE